MKKWIEEVEQNLIKIEEQEEELDFLSSNESVELYLIDIIKLGYKNIQELVGFNYNKLTKNKLNEISDWAERQPSVIKDIENYGFDSVIGSGNETFEDWLIYETKIMLGFLKKIIKRG